MAVASPRKVINRRVSPFGTASPNDCVKNSCARFISFAYLP